MIRRGEDVTVACRLSQLDAALRGRDLVYFGTRGADAESLLRLSSFKSMFSLIAPLDASSVHEISLEIETGTRIELDTYSLDLDDRPVLVELRRQLLSLFDRPSAVLPYRPCGFLSSAWFPRSDRTLYLGLFHEAQACFEHKPWVESQLARAGVRVLPWRYCADSDQPLIAEWVDRQPLVLRTNRSDGGTGVRLLEDAVALETQWPAHADGFLAAAPYFEGAVPLNINACVFDDATVTLHGPSLQIIGVPALTRRPFGYCGNDFARVVELGDACLDEFERMTQRTGRWLHEKGYRGAFGIDALLHDGGLYLTEINPRFQGSSRLAARLDAQMGRVDLFLQHAAALLHLAPPLPTPLSEIARGQPQLSHLIVHNPFDEPVTVTPTGFDENRECALEPDESTLIQPDAVAFEVVLSDSVTVDGLTLTADAMGAVNAAMRRLRPARKPATPRARAPRSGSLIRSTEVS